MDQKLIYRRDLSAIMPYRQSAVPQWAKNGQRFFGVFSALYSAKHP
jgi:hypothetical protein